MKLAPYMGKGTFYSSLLTAVMINFPGQNAVTAQVIPDNTVGTIVNSAVVNSAGSTFTIEGGTRSGNNLFHSFNQFSIPANNTAFFNNSSDIQTIFSRVTGGVVSNINGLIKTNGNANLFLLNPSGILLGPNASLSIGGSFLGTTASSIRFSDGISFSATDQRINPLLTIAVPIGLQFNGSSGGIQGVGNGSQLPSIRSFVPVSGTANLPGFRVPTGQTLALIGGPVSLAGSVLAAPQGRLEIGAVATGTVQINPSINPSIKGWTIDYSNATQFQPIDLTQGALLDVSGAQAGSIQLQSNRLKLLDGSVALIQNFGSLPSGSLRVTATESVYLSGESSKSLASTLTTETLGAGKGGDLYVTTPMLKMDTGATISLRNFSRGNSGNAFIQAQQIDLAGVSRRNPAIRTSIFTATYGTGKSGDMDIDSKSIDISRGAFIATSTFGPGLGGSLRVNASDYITITGYDPILTSPSTIGTATYSSGKSGDIQISTPQLSILGGGRMDASTFASGNAGNVRVQARDSIVVQGGVLAINNPSLISSSATLLSPAIRRILRLPDVPTGNAANVELQTRTLFISDAAIVNVRNEGSGQAGQVVIKADRVQLDRSGAITAATRSGQGGEIDITADALILRRQSSIVTTAGGLGNGGSMNLNAKSIVGLENSDIIANAVRGRGGNIKITTQELLGLQFRNQLTPNNDITASSEFGINGDVQVNTFGISPNNNLMTLPIDVVDSSNQMTDRCSGAQTSSFIATGRGGTPKDPSHNYNFDRPWQDIRDLTSINTFTNTFTNTSTHRSIHTSTIQPVIQPTPSEDVLIEANRLQINQSGTIVLVADQIPRSSQYPATCATQILDQPSH